MRGSRKFSQGGGVQSPRRGLTENFNMAKINNLAIPGGGGSGPPVPPSGSAYALIGFAVTAKLICVFVFAYADCWFSHGAAQLYYVGTQMI